jgi:hypothetical protein
MLRTHNTCTYAECDRKHHARGLCLTHYMQFKRGATPVGPIKTQQKQQVEQVRQQHANPGPDPRVVNYAKEWMDANPWYDPRGRDEDSAITKVIDNQLAAEGYNPKDADYWHELTRRVASRIGDDEAETRSSPSKRKAPPTGTTREHAPVSTKREIYVTPERKQAMIDAGIWDDVPRRNQMLKAYQAYDKSSAR